MQHIKEGMSWGQAIDIINGIIDSMTILKKAIGGCVVDNKIDYNSLANLPTINGKTISGNETSESLGIGFSDDNLSQLRQIAEIVATNTANGMLGNKASANISQLENADADVSEICFFINDKNGTPKRISIDTLTNYMFSRMEKKPEIVINNGSFKSLQKSVNSISATLKELKDSTILSSQENEDRFAAIESNFANYSTTTDMNIAIKNKADALAGDISKIYATQGALSDVDAKFANYAKTTALADYATKTALNNVDAKFANYAKTTALDSYVTKNSLSTTLGDYAKTTALADYAKTSALAGYATTTALSNVDAKFANYAKTTALDSYVTKTSLSTTLGDYAKTSALAGYATTTALSDVDAKFANYAKTTALDSYVTKNSLSTTLGDYAKTTALADYAKTSALSNYLTTTSASSTYATKTALADYAKTSALAGYATTTALSDVDAKFANYAKTTALDSYVTKTSLSTTLGDYAKTTALADYAKTSALSSYLTTTSASSTYATKTALNNVESTANTAKNTANSLVTAKIAIETLSSAKWSIDDSKRTYKKYSTSSDLDLQISSNTETGIEHYLLISNTSTKKINISLASAKSIYAETKSIELEAGSLIELSAINISNVITVTASSKLIN